MRVGRVYLAWEQHGRWSVGEEGCGAFEQEERAELALTLHTVTQDVTPDGNRGKGALGLSVLFFATSCESISISKSEVKIKRRGRGGRGGGGGGGEHVVARGSWAQGMLRRAAQDKPGGRWGQMKVDASPLWTSVSPSAQ